jgi:hypothetical protein
VVPREGCGGVRRHGEEAARGGSERSSRGGGGEAAVQGRCGHRGVGEAAARPGGGGKWRPPPSEACFGLRRKKGFRRDWIGLGIRSRESIAGSG